MSELMQISGITCDDPEEYCLNDMCGAMDPRRETLLHPMTDTALRERICELSAATPANQ